MSSATIPPAIGPTPEAAVRKSNRSVTKTNIKVVEPNIPNIDITTAFHCDLSI